MRDTTPLLAQLDQSLQTLDAALMPRIAAPDLAGHAMRLDAWRTAGQDWLASLQSSGGSGATEGES